MAKPQCPNCGSYDIYADKTSGELFSEFLAFCFVVPGFFVARRNNERATREFLAGQRTATCNICKYQMWVHELPSEPIRPDEELIRKGRQRLEEERRRRERRRRMRD